MGGQVLQGFRCGQGRADFTVMGNSEGMLWYGGGREIASWGILVGRLLVNGE